MMEANERTGLEIAVIGMAGRFPGASDIHEFWDNLKKGVESIPFFTDKELEEAGVSSQLINNPNFVKSTGGVIEDKELFDASFFEYGAHEAEVMEPQMRILHECAWTALEDAGYNPGVYNGLIGFYAGAAADFSWKALVLLSGKMNDLGWFSVMQSIQVDFLTTRISYKLNLRGPSVTVQTACSTSLVAIHQACRSILSGECSMALAGGVSFLSGNSNGYMYQEGMILSPDGHCRAFDKDARGTVSGQGVGLVVLKSLEEAIADRDYIYAVIKGSAINNDGIRKIGYTAPSIEGQAQAIRAALHMAEVEPESISYVETHGTGTIMGDPIEMEALELSFNTSKKGFCALGAVKTNIGHLDRAAGVVGFIKTVLALKHKQIPPTIHFNTPNPKINFDHSPFYINTTLYRWERGKYPLRAGVSSFGIGGTNAHVILEEAPIAQGAQRTAHSKEQEAQSAGSTVPGTWSQGRGEYQLILLSAKTESALEGVTKNFVNYLKKNPGINLADAAYTLQVGRKAFEFRRMLVSPGIEETVEALTSPEDPSSPGLKKVKTSQAKEEGRPVVFMLPGLGTQYINMGLELYRKENLFREEMDHCFEILKDLTDIDVKGVLYPNEGTARTPGSPGSPGIDHFEIAQLVIFTFEYSLARLLMTWGVMPEAMIGYSFGEYVAAALSGVFSLEDVLELVVVRGRLISRLPAGAMLSVPLPGQQLKSLLARHNELTIAIDNGPSCVVSGPPEAVDVLEEQMKQKKYLCMRLPASHAIHSKMMEPILEEFNTCVRRLTLNKPQVPYISNVTGTLVTAEEAADPGYWATHLRQTVRFADGLKELMKDPDTLFVEVGPGHELSSLLLRHLGEDRQQPAINLVRHPDREIADVYFLLGKMGLLWLCGVSIDWTAFYPGPGRHRIPLPTYPFERKRFWIEGNPLKRGGEWLAQQTSPGKNADIADWFYLPQWERSHLLWGDRWERSGQCYLIFSDGSLFCTQLVKQIRREGKNTIIVSVGSSFRKTGEGEYEIHPRQSKDYHCLLEELPENNRIPVVIVYLWNMSTGGVREWEKKNLDSTFDLGLYSLLFLVRALSRQQFKEGIYIHVLSNSLNEVTGEEQLAPQQAVVLGLLKVIPQEYANISCRSIDIVLPEPGSSHEEKLVEQLSQEFETQSLEPVIAYRGSHRWVQTFRPVRLKGTGQTPSRLKPGGIYLVTGGLGNVGFILAKYLARTLKAKLILTGRTPLPPRDEWEQYRSDHDEQDRISQKIRKVRELEALGAAVLIFNADAADYQGMKTVLQQAKGQFGQVHGVIHAAGVMAGETFKPIEEISDKEFREHFQSKVYSSLVLDRLFQGQELDFCLLVSSPSSILGGLGHAAYSAANAFIDAFVYWHNRRDNGSGSWLAVNWGDWQSKEKKDLDEQVGDPLARLRMTPQEGIKTLQCILTEYPASQVVVSAGDLRERISQWVRLEFKQETGDSPIEEPGARHERPHLLTPYVAPGNYIEEKLSHIWQMYFKLEQVGAEDNFFELGATSLDIIQLNRKIKEVLGKDIPVVTLFRYPNISTLARHLSQDKNEKNHSAKEKERAGKMHRGREKLQTRSKIRKETG